MSDLDPDVVQRAFAAARAADDDGRFDDNDVAILDAALQAALRPDAPSEPERAETPVHVSPAGIALIHEFEQCRLEAYPDPGSRNGKPVTIGWGTTRIDGKPIKMGTTITQAEADALFAADLGRFEREMINALGSSVHGTSQLQFDALASFTYNVGVPQFLSSTLLRKHKSGDFEGAAAQFRRWVFNDGVKMRGLVRRRAAEESLYRSGM